MLLKKHLQQRTKEELIAQIMELEKKYKDVKVHYQFSLNPDPGLHAEKVKKVIHKFFNSSQGYDPKLREARKEISGFIKLSPPKDSLADVMLFYVECGVQYTLDYGDISESYYNSIAGMFRDACKFISENGFSAIFKSRGKKIMDDTANIGWGFHDEVSDYYHTWLNI